MKTFVRGILHPEAFHGERARSPFFEGWYLKLVTADESRSLALIPGLFRGRAEAEAHAFIQIVDPTVNDIRYESFPIEAFSGADAKFEVQLGKSTFGASGFTLDLPGCSGEIKFGELNPWPVTTWSPGVMGWYAWVPIMQCYHGILSLNHQLSGTLSLHGQTLNFDNGKGYIEKDWGRSFPKRWVWMQSNHFAHDQDACITASLADIPWFGGAFPGFLIGLWYQGSLLRMTTYTGAKIVAVDRLSDGVRLEIKDHNHTLELVAEGGQAMALRMPSESSMEGIVHEHLGATIHVLLRRRHDGTILFEGTGQQAAYEVQGDVRRLRRRFPFTRDIS